MIIIEPNVMSATGRGGTGAVATAVIAGGAVTGITINNGGSGYVTGQVNAYFGLCGGNIGSVGGAAGANSTGGTGGPGLGWGNIGNVGFNNSGLSVGQGGGGSSSNAQGSCGEHGGIYIRSYK